MKRVIVALVVLFAGFSPASAETPPAIVVIDTGVNSSLFKDSIVYEVCLVSSFKCPNGKMTMEGVGAANLPATTDKTFNHGTQMVSLVLKVNPTAKVIPIRIVGMSATGTPGFYSLDDVQSALNWVVANRIKYNIAVVSLAQGAVFAGCKVPTGMAQNIATLKAANVPVVTAVGNDGNHTAVFSPACLPDTVSVGATDNPDSGVSGIAYDKKAAPYIARYSNGAQGQTDFFLNARWYATMLDGSTKFTVGTSNSTAVMAGWWLLNRKESFDATFNALMATTVSAKNEFQTGRYIVIP
jgi:Subtilase family